MALSRTGDSGGEGASRAGRGVAIAVIRAPPAVSRLDPSATTTPTVDAGARRESDGRPGTTSERQGRGVYGWLPELANGVTLNEFARSNLVAFGTWGEVD